MKALFIADPVPKLNPQSDTTLCLAAECVHQGVEVFFTTQEGIEFRGDRLVAYAQRVTRLGRDELPQMCPREAFEIRQFSWAFIRKDPPFNSDYVKLCWLLALAEKHTRFINRPSHLLRYHEKLIPLDAVAQGYLQPGDIIPTHIGTLSQAQNWVEEQGYDPLVVKPFLGFGGGDIALIGRQKFLAATQYDDRITQPFREEVRRRGDRRVLYWRGDMVAQFARMPRPGDFVSNLARGGTAVHSDPTPEELIAIERLGAFLKAVGIDFAGADLIGRFVSEVNITSPTGLRHIERMESKNYAQQIIESLTA